MIYVDFIYLTKVNQFKTLSKYAPIKQHIDMRHSPTNKNKSAKWHWGRHTPIKKIYEWFLVSGLEE